MGLPGVEVVALADPDEAGRAAAMKRSGAGRGYGSYHEMLERERLDLVAVGPSHLDQHEKMVVAAARAGAKAIYCEKPIARSLDEADRMLAECETRGVKVAVAHQNRAFPAQRLVRRAIAEGKIGTLRRMRAWPKQDSRGGGLELLVHGTHMFDLMRLFAGDARWCHARVTCGGRDATADDAQEGQYAVGPIAGDDITTEHGFGHGVTGHFESMLSDDGGATAYLRMEVSGSGGTMAFWSAADSAVYFTPRPYPLPDDWGSWQRLEPEEMPILPGAGRQHAANQVLVRDLLAAVEEDRTPLASGHDARAALEMILAAYESHLCGERVALPMARRTHPLQTHP